MSSKKIAQSKNSILLDIDGMKCGSCVQAVEKILKSYPNVTNASVNLVTKTAFIELLEAKKPLTELIKTLTSKGFPSKERDYQIISNNIESDQNGNKNLFCNNVTIRKSTIDNDRISWHCNIDVRSSCYSLKNKK